MNEKVKQEKFKAHLRKIGSGEQTSSGLTREAAAEALILMMNDIPTPAQIGAFMIAHRIRRPEPQELAGMVDTYLTVGPRLQSNNNQHWPICFGMPLDGRTKKTPIYPLTTLVLLAAKQPVVLHSANSMPVKYGVSTEELFRMLGLCLSGLSLKQVQDGFLENDLAVIHQPDHFPLAESLIPYRDQIGKRSTIASMELLWTAHEGKHLLVTGFVHPPTQERHIKTLKMLGETHIFTIKGLEGGTDLPISRFSKSSLIKNQTHKNIVLNPKEYSLNGTDLPFNEIEQWKLDSLQALNGKGPLANALIWNSAVYLWFSEKVKTIDKGIEEVRNLTQSGSVETLLKKLIKWRANL